MIDRQWNHTTAKWLRQGDLVQAEIARRNRAAPNRAARPGAYSAAMARVGRALTRLGDTLQQRYQRDQKQLIGQQKYPVHAP